jgi:outer membrane cobalamin receptor
MKKYDIYLIFTLMPLSIHAEPATELPPIVITSDHSSNISNYNHDDLHEVELPDLNGVLRQNPSITVNQGSGQMTSDLSFRGARGQGMLTLDGVPLFSNFVGVYSLQRYSINELESVKFSRSFDGNFSGSRTLGGAIHLKTRQLQENDNFLHFEGGSYDTLRESAGAGFTSELGDFSGIFGRSDVFNGVSESRFGTERDQYEMNHASGNWSKNFDKGELDASFYFVKSKQDIDDAGLLPDNTFGWVDDLQGKLSDETWVAQLHGQYDLASNWNSSLQFGFTQNQQKMKTTLVKPFSVTNQLFMADWKNTHQFRLSENHRASIVWGVNTQHQQALNVPSSSQTIISPNVHCELVLDTWKLDADTRLDLNEIYGNHQVFSLGANRALSQTTNIWAKGGTGYRQPGMSELVHPTLGNKTLKSESSKGGEIGLRWNPFLETEINVSGYYQNYQQMILMLFDPTNGKVRANNLPEANVFGLEIQSQHRWSDFWKSGLNYGYMSAKNAENNLYVPNLPEHQGSFWNELQLLQPLKMRVDLTFHDGYFLDGSNNRRADAAPRLNALLKYQFTPKTNLYLRGENIANNRTIEIGDFAVNGAAVYFGLQTGF